MLLQKLMEYAGRESDSEDLPLLYELTPIKWLIQLDSKGNYQGIICTTGNTKKNDRGKEYPAPAVVRSSGVKPKLLADRADYVLGITADDANPKQIKRTDECHQAFLQLVKECAIQTKLPEVQAVEAFLSKLDLRILDLPEDIVPEDNITFVVGNVMPINLLPVQEMWANSQASTEEVAQCLVCGGLKPPMKRQPIKIKGIPGGQSSGMALVSANAKAFESYGLEASLIAPICQKCAYAYGQALNSLIKGDDSHLTVGPSVYVFWTREESSFTPVQILSTPEPNDIKKLIESVYSAKSSFCPDPTQFYALSLTSSGGRVAIRDWFVTTVGEVQKNLAHYFKAQRLVDREGEYGQPYGLFTLAVSLFASGKEIKPHVVQAFINAALLGRHLPRWVLYQAIRRCAVEQQVTRPRAAIIKMVLVWGQNREKEEELMEKLDPGNCNPGYLCGRLLAVLEFIQEAAVPGIKATIVDRYYGTASSAPASVYGRLLRTTQAHLAKLRKEKAGAYVSLQRLMGEVLGELKEFPTILSLQDQALFALGYYHQRVAGWGSGSKQNSETTGSNTTQSEEGISDDDESLS
ncbi:MAG: type I-C CRISPR-associated protein Cas8c/Csd1 [Firmicutes bacterium]|nr:type I-C CRISPR-associated protein Cas8c/Csd1 [Bacillota bacterium]